MSRLSKDHYFMGLAQVAAGQTTCVRRGVGCVLVNPTNHIMAVAYNGVAKGQPHCNEVSYVPAKQGAVSVSSPVRTHLFTEPRHPHACSDSSKDGCEAVHAEQNAILQCAGTDSIATAYCTRSPCKNCLKLLLNTSCSRIVFQDAHSDPLPREMWLKAGRAWEQLPSS